MHKSGRFIRDPAAHVHPGHRFRGDFHAGRDIDAFRAADANAAPRATDPVDNAVLSAPSAANAARMLRMGEDSDSVAYWDTAQPDASTYFRLRKAIRAMLSCTVGNGIIPVGREGIQFQPDPEIPLMAQDEKLQKGVDYNTRGSVYSNSPLTSVTASFIPRNGGKDEIASVVFDPAEQVTSYSLDTKSEHSAREGIGDSFDISGLPAGQYTFTLTATSVDIPAPVTLYRADCSIADSKDMCSDTE